jgi:ribonuclease P protein component
LPRGSELSPVRVAVSVPKKRTPLAVNRNRIKRLIREAWRLNKDNLYASLPPEKQLHLFFIFTGNPNPEFQQVEQSVQKIIAALQQLLNLKEDA